jgi:hypothetical protein
MPPTCTGVAPLTWLMTNVGCVAIGLDVAATISTHLAAGSRKSAAFDPYQDRYATPLRLTASAGITLDRVGAPTVAGDDHVAP